MRIRQKLGMWAVINPPASVKYFKTEKLAKEYVEMMTTKVEEPEVEKQDEPFTPFYVEK